jgi:hypothetical protein
MPLTGPLMVESPWRHLLYHAVNNTLFHSEQYGGIPGRDSLAIPFIEEMQMEITRTSRYPIVKTDFLDATSCYDRIPPNFLASLSCRGLGMHHDLCVLHATALREAQYLLKTQLGVTETGYTHSASSPIYGTGQGSPNSPLSIWTSKSSTLFKAYDTRDHSAVFKSPDRRISVSFGMVGFMDDTYSTSRLGFNSLGSTQLRMPFSPTRISGKASPPAPGGCLVVRKSSTVSSRGPVQDQG